MFSEVKQNFMKWNFISLHTMFMQTTPKNKGFLYRAFKFFVRSCIVIASAYFAVGCLLDIYMRDEVVFVDISRNVTNGGIYIGCFVRVLYFFCYDKDVEEIIDEMDRIFKENSETGLTEKDMSSSKTFAYRFCLFWGFVTFFTGQFTALLPLAFLHETGIILPLQAWFPWSWEEHYVPTYIFIVFAQYCMGFAYGVPDIFYTCSMYLTANQFDVISWEFENLIYTALLDFGIPKSKVVAFRDTFNDYGENGKLSQDVIETTERFTDVIDLIRSEEFTPVLRQKFQKCVEYHQNLLYFSGLLFNFFSPFMIPCLACATFYLIFIPFSLLITTDSSAFLTLLEYLLTASGQIFILSMCGEMVTQSSASIKDSLYHSPWYLCNGSFLTNFKFAHYRSFKPVVIKVANYFNVNLELFVNVCRTTGSYFAFLLQVTE